MVRAWVAGPFHLAVSGQFHRAAALTPNPWGLGLCGRISLMLQFHLMVALYGWRTFDLIFRAFPSAESMLDVWCWIYPCTYFSAPAL